MIIHTEKKTSKVIPHTATGSSLHAGILENGGIEEEYMTIKGSEEMLSAPGRTYETIIPDTGDFVGFQIRMSYDGVQGLCYTLC